MKVISIKVEEEFHIRMKIKATKNGKSIKEYVMNLIEKDLEKDLEKEKEQTH